MSFRKTRIVTLRWTGLINIGNDVAPDTDYVIYLGGSERVSVMFNTNPADTGSPTFDLHTIASNDLATYGGATSGHWQNNIFTAQAKDILNFAAITLGPRAIKFRIDVNAAALAATEYIEAVVFIDDMSPGGRAKPVMS